MTLLTAAETLTVARPLEEVVVLDPVPLAVLVAAPVDAPDGLVVGAVPVAKAPVLVEVDVLVDVLSLSDVLVDELSSDEDVEPEPEPEPEPFPGVTSTAAVSEEGTEVVQKPALVEEGSKAPTWPATQQKPFPWLFLYKDQEGSAHEGEPSTAPMQLAEVGQQAAATNEEAAIQVKDLGQKAPPPQEVSPETAVLDCRDHPPFDWRPFSWTAEAPEAATRRRML